MDLDNLANQITIAINEFFITEDPEYSYKIINNCYKKAYKDILKIGFKIVNNLNLDLLTLDFFIFMLDGAKAHFEGVSRSFLYDNYVAQREMRTYYGKDKVDFVMSSGTFLYEIIDEDHSICREFEQACRSLSLSLNC